MNTKFAFALLVVAIIAVAYASVGHAIQQSANPDRDQRGQVADAARWTAMADYYQRHPELLTLP